MWRASGLVAVMVLFSGWAQADAIPPSWRLDHYQFGEGFSLPADGAAEVQVWAWAPAGKATWISLNGDRINLDREGNRTDGYTWRHLSAKALPRGEKIAVDGHDEIAAITLSDSPAYDPEEEMKLTRVLQQPGRVDDRRHLIERGTNTVFTMPIYKTREDWEAKAAIIRQRILLGCGLDPNYLNQNRPALNAKVFGRIERDGYTVEKAYFEAWPGFLVTGNLYRPFPLPEDTKVPAILCPHGHWEHGRLEDTDKCSVPGRSITLARMGATVFTYDMVGYNDSLQITDHHFLNPEADETGIHPFGLQLWSSIRGIDFLQSLPEVDPERIGCTGASGGGTQTFALYAVDPRIKVAAPVNMISCSMQGGCVCENAPLIRLDNSNMEIGAMMAPKPLLMVSATGDWTRETPRIEYPSVRSIYALYDAEDNVETVQIDSGHNYNKASREAVYRFFAKHLFGYEGYENFTEPPYQMEPVEDLRVFPDGVLPEGFLKGDALLAELKATVYADAAVRTRMSVTAIPVSPDEITPERLSMEERDNYVIERWVVRRGPYEAVPMILFRPRGSESSQVCIGRGSNENASIGQRIMWPLNRYAIIDLVPFGGGDFIDPFEGPVHYPMESGFASTFMPSIEQQQNRDIETVRAFVELRRDLFEPRHSSPYCPADVLL
ncbi:MAG: hypothetical protein GC168_19180 [Candidatus Hydrogenedens sp.]|nr:hypothetical protein [Candidatus Hydrogenedens sp.]